MNVVEILLIAVGGGLGAAARFGADRWVMRRRTGRFPWGILVVNVVGSFVLGVVAGSLVTVAPMWAGVLGTGLLGGFTTFSTVSVESVLLVQRGAWRLAVANLLGTLLPALAAAAAGLALGSLIVR